jgi:hypothetical protein
VAVTELPGWLDFSATKAMNDPDGLQTGVPVLRSGKLAEPAPT